MFSYVAYYNSIDISISPRNGHYHAHDKKNMLTIKLKHSHYGHYINTVSFMFLSTIDFIMFSLIISTF